MSGTPFSLTIRGKFMLNFVQFDLEPLVESLRLHLILGLLLRQDLASFALVLLVHPEPFTYFILSRWPAISSGDVPLPRSPNLR